MAGWEEEGLKQAATVELQPPDVYFADGFGNSRRLLPRSSLCSSPQQDATPSMKPITVAYASSLPCCKYQPRSSTRMLTAGWCAGATRGGDYCRLGRGQCRSPRTYKRLLV